MHLGVGDVASHLCCRGFDCEEVLQGVERCKRYGVDAALVRSLKGEFETGGEHERVSILDDVGGGVGSGSQTVR